MKFVFAAMLLLPVLVNSAEAEEELSVDEVCSLPEKNGDYLRLLQGNSLPIIESEFGEVSGRYDRSGDFYTCLAPFEAITSIMMGKDINLDKIHELDRSKDDLLPSQKEGVDEMIRLLEVSQAYEQGVLVVKVVIYFKNGQPDRFEDLLLRINH